jgi:hypothetical protein
MATNADAYELTKAQLSKQQRLMKSKPARKFMKKRQLERGGVGNGFYKTHGRGPDGTAPGKVQKADGYIRTVYDMIDYYYGFVPEYTSKTEGGSQLGKADDGLLTTDSGVRNAVYGSEVFSLVNSEPNLFALLENRAWTKSGERIINEHGHAMGSGGLPENSELPETDHPEFDQFEQTPKTIAHNFDVSQAKQLLADTDDDDLDNPFEFLRRWYGTGTEHQTGMGEHPKHLNVQLSDDADTPAGMDLESIDRVISDAEEANDILSSPDDADIYGFQRDNNEFESNVIHNGGSNRTFVIDHLDDAIRSIKESSGKNPVTDDNYFFLTNHDTYQRIEDEVGGKERLEAERVQVGLNGVQTNPGGDVGITVQSYKNIPIFESVDVEKDGIGRVYLIDSSTMYIKTLLPTQFYSTGTEVDGNPFSLNRLGNEGMYVTIGELTCVNPSAQAKIRDLK